MIFLKEETVGMIFKYIVTATWPNINFLLILISGLAIVLGKTRSINYYYFPTFRLYFNYIDTHNHRQREKKREREERKHQFQLKIKSKTIISVLKST